MNANRTTHTLYGVRPDQNHVIDHRHVRTIGEVRGIIAEYRQFGWGSMVEVIRFGIDWSDLITETHIPLRRPDFPFDLSPDTGID